MRYALTLWCWALAVVYGSLGAQASGELTEEQRAKLDGLVAESAVFGLGFTGFALYDPTARVYLYTHQADQYFTPASNVKILTLLTSISLLGEGLPLVFYRSERDTLWCWGTGNPMLFHPELGSIDSLGRWLSARPERVIALTEDHWHTPRFGEGWSWDDYNTSYQCDRAALPVFGNRVRWRKSGRTSTLESLPPYFNQQLVYRDEPYENTPLLDRAEGQNIFYFGRKALRRESLREDIPFYYSLETAAALLADTLNRVVVAARRPLPDQYEVLRQPAPDTLYQLMMQESDNFLADQLLLMGSAERYGQLSVRQLLDYARDTLLRGAPHPLEWVDGSGLSRYNQLTPRTLVQVLEQLHNLLTETWLFSVFPAGGKSGTIKGWYAGEDGQPFVYAKTGTLRHVHCLSGYLRTRNNRTLIFSFMHNNFPRPISELRREMDKALRWMRDNL